MLIAAEARSFRMRLAVGRVVDARGACGWSVGDRLLARSPDASLDEIDALPSACVRLPRDLAAADALLVPPIAHALRAWRTLGLELGEAAVIVDDGERADLVSLLASWHGALPVVRVTERDDATRDDVETVTVRDAAAAVERLRALTAAAPGVAAIDLSGRGHIIAVLLESLPRWGRLMLAGPPPDPFTTAFYTDIHRKGVVVRAADEVSALFVEPATWALDVRNACRLLTNAAHATALRACVADELVTVAASGAAG